MDMQTPVTTKTKMGKDGETRVSEVRREEEYWID